MKGCGNMKIIRAILLAVVALCLIPLGQARYSSLKQRQQEELLKELRETAGPEIPGRDDASAAGDGDGPGDQTAAGNDDGPGEKYTSGGDGERGRESASGSGGETGEMSASGGNPQRESDDSTTAMTESPEGSIPDSDWRAGAADGAQGQSKYEVLYEENRDLTGWLFIEGTNIDYPVMQCGDDEYYLHHDFYGNDSKYGCLYVRNIADVNTPGTNFIIYGHNMKDGSMFGDLDLYRKESFWREHPTICFDTLYEERVYEVIAAFPSQVFHADENAFKYYQFYSADTQEEFDYFYENIKELSLYDTGVNAGFGDTFLTLSTCAYHTDDGRFVVVAKAMAAGS